MKKIIVCLGLSILSACGSVEKRPTERYIAPEERIITVKIYGITADNPMTPNFEVQEDTFFIEKPVYLPDILVSDGHAHLGYDWVYDLTTGGRVCDDALVAASREIVRAEVVEEEYAKLDVGAHPGITLEEKYTTAEIVSSFSRLLCD
ncbi:MAG: hypothetical protein F6K62_10320 [Sphaerospermopsis sp. SIO1G2]|nr:hypothetical protein [Sphaerospermopsis sp. SIO1G2]